MKKRSASGKRVGDGRKLAPMILVFTIVTTLIILVIIINARSPALHSIYTGDSIFFERATVTSVLGEDLEPASGMPGWMLGKQEILVRMKNGPQKGKEIRLENYLSTSHNIRVRPGQAVIIKADRPTGITPYYTVYNYDRTPGLIAISVIFILSMLAVGRLKGARSVLGLGVSLFFILGFLVPAIYRGYPPILMAVLTVLVIAAFSLLMLNGFSRKTLTAMLASAACVLLSAGFFYLLSAILSLSGYNAEGMEELIMVSRSTGLRIGQVLFVGVLISSLGAIFDMTISISSALYEIKRLRPELPPAQLFHSGMSMGQDVIGTMCHTLILAFVGSALGTMLVLISYGTQLEQFMSSDYIAVEVVHGITGSLAVIAAVPITSGLCAFFAGGKSYLNFYKNK